MRRAISSKCAHVCCSVRRVLIFLHNKRQISGQRTLTVRSICVSHIIMDMRLIKIHSHRSNSTRLQIYLLSYCLFCWATFISKGLFCINQLPAVLQPEPCQERTGTSCSAWFQTNSAVDEKNRKTSTSSAPLMEA